ncbi:MAG: hypothetical protein KF819_22615 [Labilithrix sp.]|nr:hypothetical protein [Labilithrix sp.]
MKRALLVAASAFALALARPALADDEEPPPYAPHPPPSPRVVPPPDATFVYADPQPYPSLAWLALQFLPSPEVGFGGVKRIDPLGQAQHETLATFGLRWQLTPALWSWGTNRRISRWRFFVVDPLARHAGSIELHGTLEYLWGHVDRMLVRPGVRAYFPLLHRGEYLSASIGTSTYQYENTARVAYDVGAYVLFGLFGVNVTVAPAHDPLTTIATFRIRYF